MCLTTKTLFSALLLCTLLTASNIDTAQAEQLRATDKTKQPRIEVCFVLDTTGSMSGLIEGAKQKIWSIANQMATAKPTPEIKFGLIGYRDRKDEYITKTYDLTNDLDATYAHLRDFKADGGGDEPESVNQALSQAVTQMSWSKDKDVLKIIFLVGDAPPHMDYQDDVKYPKSCEQAAKNDIIINTIQCGTATLCAQPWRDIATKAEGQYVQIDQSGGMAAVSTPMDADMARLSGELAATVVPFGDREAQTKVMEKADLASGKSGASASSLADRAGYMAKSAPAAAAAAAAPVVSGSGDLVQALAEKQVSLEEVAKRNELPEHLQKMTAPQRQAYLDEQTQKRSELRKQLDALSAKRDAYMKDQIKNLKGDSFDAKVNQLIQTQAKKKGIDYASPATTQSAK